MKKHLKSLLALVLALGFLLAGCTGREHGLSPENPVTITVWHYYNGDQQKAFDEMVREFNTTVGTEKGILVEGHSQGDVNQLEEKVLAAANGQVGSDEMPDIFASYADTAYAIDRMGLLTDLDQYITKEEQETYWPSYIEEGRIGEHGELKIFPTAKSTEILMINKTVFDRFSAETGVTAELLQTKEGVVQAAKVYYEWTDAQTPDIAHDGKAFYGRDALANLFIIGGMQLGTELFEVQNGTVTLHVDKEVMRRIWDCYYIPTINGWFYAGGRFRSDDLRVGDIIAYTGSTASATYFPVEVTQEEKVLPIELLVLPTPVFEGAVPYAVQQGAGMVVTKSNDKEEYASVLFLKWLTESERNLDFAASVGYLPVKKAAVSTQQLNDFLERQGALLDPSLEPTLRVAFEEVTTTPLYTNKAFESGSASRKILEYNLFDKAQADRAAVLEAVQNGADYDEAVAAYATDENFEDWYAAFTAKLQQLQG